MKGRIDALIHDPRKESSLGYSKAHAGADKLRISGIRGEQTELHRIIKHTF